MWKNLEQLRCVAHLLFIVGSTIALTFSLGTAIVRIQNSRVSFACTKSFSISRQKRLSMSAKGVSVPGAQFDF